MGGITFGNWILYADSDVESDEELIHLFMSSTLQGSVCCGSGFELPLLESEQAETYLGYDEIKTFLLQNQVKNSDE